MRTSPSSFTAEYALLSWGALLSPALHGEQKQAHDAPKKQDVAVREVCTAGMINSMHVAVNNLHLTASLKDCAAAHIFTLSCCCTSGGYCDHLSNKLEPRASVSTMGVSHNSQPGVLRSGPEVDRSS